MDQLQALSDGVAALRLSRPVGRVVGVHAGLIAVSGLAQEARVGDELTLYRVGQDPLMAEILRIDGTTVEALPHGGAQGVRLQDRVVLTEAPKMRPSAQWVGRVLDPFGKPLDGLPAPMPGPVRNLTGAPPPAAARRGFGERLSTGFDVFNTLLPIVKGQRVGLFAGSGVGKSQLLGRFAKYLDSDVAVIALIGERGRELSEFVRQTLGPDGLKRSVVIAATSDQSALVRRRCAWAAMCVAEAFRDEGKSVLFLADSITRFAEAHREIATLSGEAPALRGYPASVSSLIMSLCERAGPGVEGQGDITAVLSVLVAGSDMEEPVADILRGVLDGHVVLDRAIAERGRYPAIDVLRSVSRSLPGAASDRENEIISEARRLLGAYEENATMVKAGLYTAGTDPTVDTAVRLWPELDAFASRQQDQSIAESFSRLELILRRGQVGTMVSDQRR